MAEGGNLRCFETKEQSSSCCFRSLLGTKGAVIGDMAKEGRFVRGGERGGRVRVVLTAIATTTISTSNKRGQLCAERGGREKRQENQSCPGGGRGNCLYSGDITVGTWSVAIRIWPIFISSRSPFVRLGRRRGRHWMREGLSQETRLTTLTLSFFPFSHLLPPSRGSVTVTVDR
ncbi:hypothetical protein LZ32DRAFT_376719 [Colletotrichum eremochloae]|nr:hypothetical protein LZ32DRAFT_376719 [Colletotrichum eremochloae]